MITIDYVTSLYRFAYSIIGPAAQDNVRYTMNDWWEFKIGADVFHDDICRALAVDTNARKVLGI
jgi:hypothetical protein